MKILKYLIVGCATFATCGIVGWRVSHSYPVEEVGILDPSLSTLRNCDGLTAMAKAMLLKPGLQPGSTFALLVMGSSRNDPQPKRLLDMPVPVPPDSVFGRDDDGERAKQQEFLGQLQSACKSSAGTQASPILEAVRQGVAHLRSRGCSKEGRCYLSAQTDLEENVDPILTPVIMAAIHKRPAAVPEKLAGAIDNAGIEVTFCGIAELSPKNGVGLSPNQLAEIWRGLFSHPDMVTFQPYCIDR